MAFLAVYITHPNEAVAKEISDRLISEKIVACANIFPIESAYWWKGKIEKEGEFVSLVKTRKSHFDRLQIRVKELHPYETPCIMATEVWANEEYERWIEDSVI